MVAISTHRADFRLTMFGAAICLSLFFNPVVFNYAVFSQGNNGNGNNGIGNLPIKGPTNLPMWGLNGNIIGTGNYFGTNNNFPIIVKVNSATIASFTNSGFSVLGNLHGTSATVDSIITGWQVMVEDALSVSGDATFDGLIYANNNIILLNGKSINQSGGNGSFTFDGFGSSNTIALGYNINSPASAQGLVIAPAGNSQYPNGAVFLGDANPNGEIMIALDSAAGGRLNIRGWEKKTYLVNDGGERITLDGVNGNSKWETTKGLTLTTRTGTTFTENYHLNVAGNLNTQKYYQNDTLVDIVNLQNTVANVKSSQWQNDTVNPGNIYYDSGKVGIGTNSPAAKLDVYGSARITGDLYVGGELMVSDKFSAKTIVTDTIKPSIGSEKITMAAPVLAQAIRVDTLLVSEKFLAEKAISSDTLIAVRQLDVNHNLSLGSDSGSTESDISSKVKLLTIQSSSAETYDVAISAESSSRVGIGTKYPTEKLSVDGSVSVSGNITAAGNISADCVTASCLNVSGQTSFDSLRAGTKIKTMRITPLEGDSVIHFGNNSLDLYPDWHLLATDNPLGIRIGNPNITFDDGFGAFAQFLSQLAMGQHSTAIGYNVGVSSNGNYSMVLGSGVQNTAPGTDAGSLINGVPNSLRVGFNSDIPTLTVTGSSGLGTTGNVGIGTTNPEQKLDVRSRINVRGPGIAGPNFTGIDLINDGTNLYTRAQLCFKNVAPVSSDLCMAIQNGGTNGNFFTMRNQNPGGGGGFLDYVNFDLKSHQIIFNSNKTTSDNYGNVVVANGSVGIGITDPTAKLHISMSDDGDAFSISKNSDSNFKIKGNGVAYAREVYIYAEDQTIPDYVFAENYSLAGWEKEKDHWKKNRHLLGVPSSNSIENEGAVNIKEMQFATLKKLEELYLYVDELKTELQLQKSENEKLRTEIENINKK